MFYKKFIIIYALIGSNLLFGSIKKSSNPKIDELDLSTTSRKALLNPICVENDSPIQVNDILKTYHLQGEKLRNKLEDLATNACSMRDITKQLFDQNEFQDRVL